MVLGVSPDSARKHRNFRAKYALPFTLLADTDHAIAEAYGVWKEKSMFGHKYMGVARTTFIIDPEGVITHVFDDIDTSTHANEVADALQ